MHIYANTHISLCLSLSDLYALQMQCIRAFPRAIRKVNVLFNDTLNTFYLRLYGIRHMVKDHSDSEKGNSLPTHRLLFPINS